ncbi:1011_t:CDS:2 [Funneliformis mosseae]|uniref:1011_t:CDS:1 n=1 Tax=Funneliformis mosseae TaxID=27381 RepID=A0A9N9C0U9_FUNMO|nr:1011_t:CDS:2 [Funneliformis mosseae]
MAKNEAEFAFKKTAPVGNPSQHKQQLDQTSSSRIRLRNDDTCCTIRQE